MSYQRRGLEDAQHEQELEVKSKAEETYLWEEQKQYEKELKKNDRRAHRAYLQGKKRVMPRTTIIVTVIVIIASTGISMQDIITMNIENHVMKIELLGLVNTQIGVRTPQVRLGLLV
jgi:hypothetical protein